MVPMHGTCGMYPPYNEQVIFRTTAGEQYVGETVRTHDSSHAVSAPAFYVESINKLFLALEVAEWQLSRNINGLVLLAALFQWCR